MAKNPPAMQETQVQFLGWEDLLEKEMATHSSILVWKIPWTEKPGRLQVMGLQRVRQDLVTKQQQEEPRVLPAILSPKPSSPRPFSP